MNQSLSDRTTTIKVIVPRWLARLPAFEQWRPEHRRGLFSKLATDHATGTATLTDHDLAILVDAFKDEPLPESLRTAVIGALTGTRERQHGRPRVRQSAAEQCDLAMLPGAYEMAMEEAKLELQRLKTEQQKQPRRAKISKLPTRRELALALVRKWLPTLPEDMTDQRLANLISERRALVRDDDAE